jgi:glycosyltransferase involved in cell wall biosynthesis
VIFISTTAWRSRLIPFSSKKPLEWLPVPSNVAVSDDKVAVSTLRKMVGKPMIVGHFGTRDYAITRTLNYTLTKLAEESSEVGVVFIGRGGEDVKKVMVQSVPRLWNQVYATGDVSEREISTALSSCDLMVQPYVDGVTTRRTTVMAGLAHQRAILTTAGALTEPIWSRTGAVALTPAGEDGALYGKIHQLLADKSERDRLASAGRRLYEKSFSLSHTIRALRVATRE